MITNNISRIRRRKLERDAALRDYHALASELGLKLISVRGVRPEVWSDAVDLLNEARGLLPKLTNIMVYSASPETGIYITAANSGDPST